MRLSRPSESTTLQREDAVMNKTRRSIAVGAFVLLAVLGTAWAYERTLGIPQAYGPSGAVAAPAYPVPPDAPVTDGAQEYDRSDLFLPQG
jgi:hypothetical protein